MQSRYITIFTLMHMKVLTLGLIFSLSILTNLDAQVRFVEDASVQSLMSRFSSLQKQQISQKAWRIQVVTTNDRRNMEQAISKLNQLYPQLDHHWTHASPYYQLKVGAFEEKEDLQNLLITLKKDFPSAIPVMDDIEKTELL